MGLSVYLFSWDTALPAAVLAVGLVLCVPELIPMSKNRVRFLGCLIVVLTIAFWVQSALQRQAADAPRYDYAYSFIPPLDHQVTSNGSVQLWLKVTGPLNNVIAAGRTLKNYDNNTGPYPINRFFQFLPATSFATDIFVPDGIYKIDIDPPSLAGHVREILEIHTTKSGVEQKISIQRKESPYEIILPTPPFLTLVQKEALIGLGIIFALLLPTIKRKLFVMRKERRA